VDPPTAQSDSFGTFCVVVLRSSTDSSQEKVTEILTALKNLSGAADLLRERRERVLHYD
jgi:hypothetical protein